MDFDKNLLETIQTYDEQRLMCLSSGGICRKCLQKCDKEATKYEIAEVLMAMGETWVEVQCRLSSLADEWDEPPALTSVLSHEGELTIQVMGGWRQVTREWKESNEACRTKFLRVLASCLKKRLLQTVLRNQSVIHTLRSFETEVSA